MLAHKPEECDLLISDAIKAKDLEAALALYEPNAAFVLSSGEVVTGQAALRKALKPFMELEEFDFTTDIKAFLSADQDIAMLRRTWSATAKAPDGKLIKLSGKTSRSSVASRMGPGVS